MTELEKVQSVIGEVYVDTHELEKEVRNKLDAYEVYCEGKKAYVLFEKHGQEYVIDLNVEDKYYHLVSVKMGE